MVGTQVALVNSADHVLADAGQAQIRDSPGMLLSICPRLRCRHSDCDRLRGLNTHVNISAVGGGSINASSVEVGGIELRVFIARGNPIEGSRRRKRSQR